MKDKIAVIIETGIKWIFGNIEGKGWGAFVKRMIVFIVILVLVIAAYIIFSEENFWEDNYQEPLFSFSEEKETDCIKADISLRAGSIIVIPLLAVKYNDEIIRTIKLSYYYNDNEVSLSSNSEGESCFFLEVDEQQRKKKENLSYIIKKMLNEKTQNNEFQVEEVYLADIMYQNKKSDKSREHIYWYLTEKEPKRIMELEMEFWKPEDVINLEEYEPEEFIYSNSQLIQAVDGCMEVVNK